MTKRRKLISPPKNGELIDPHAAHLQPTADERNLAVVDDLTKQHPIYGAFGYAFEQLGGVDGLVDWAEDHPTDFYRIFSRMVPKEKGEGSQINIQINNQLGPTPLDE